MTGSEISRLGELAKRRGRPKWASLIGRGADVRILPDAEVVKCVSWQVAGDALDAGLPAVALVAFPNGEVLLYS